jgi:hypothetical protein
MVRFIQLNRDAPLSIPGHHFLVFTNGTLQVPGTAPIHAVEPEQRDRAPGVMDRVCIHFRQTDKVIRTGISTHQRGIARLAGLI